MIAGLEQVLGVTAKIEQPSRAARRRAADLGEIDKARALLGYNPSTLLHGWSGSLRGMATA